MWWSHLEELKGELQVVRVHGVDGVLGPLGGLQGVATFRLGVSRFVAVGADHADLQGGGHLVHGRGTELVLLLVFVVLLNALQRQLDSVGDGDRVCSSPCCVGFFLFFF